MARVDLAAGSLALVLASAALFSGLGRAEAPVPSGVQAAEIAAIVRSEAELEAFCAPSATALQYLSAPDTAPTADPKRRCAGR